MKISEFTGYMKAAVEIQIEGFFTERFLNLCKINNIKILKVRQINVGLLQITLSPKEYKKIKPYIKKTKCKMKILNKKGIYFNFFKYRKRRIALYFMMLIVVGVYVFSTYIWHINVYGNDKISNEEILEILEEYGVKVGTSSFSIEKFKTADYIRAKIYDVAWVGLDIKGTTLNVQVVEKIISNEKEEMSLMGDVICNVDCILTKIIAQDGTTRYKVGDKCEVGKVLIEGKIYTDANVEKKVHAMGVIKGKVESTFQKEYNYTDLIKKEMNKTRFGLGVSIKEKEYILKYLPNNEKYDINKNEIKFNLFGMNFSFIFNKYIIYQMEEVNYTYDELVEKAIKDAVEYEQTLLIGTNEITKKIKNIEQLETGIRYTVVYEVEKDVGEFRKLEE